MIDHIGIIVRSIETSRAFYTEVLRPLGYGFIEQRDEWVAFGAPGVPLFWMHASKDGADAALTPIHIAFVAEDRAAVDRFHAQGLAAGATDSGAPGLRQIYHPNYYGAFILDPDGNNIEAVCHTAE